MASSPDPEELARLARVEQAVESRSRRALWDRLAEDEATLTGALERFASQGREVRIGTGSGEHVGLVVEVGPDHVALADQRGRRYVRMNAIESVVAGPGETQLPTPGAVVVEHGFDDVLARLAGEDRSVTLVLRSGRRHRGTVETRGTDVLTMRQDDPMKAVYVSPSAVVEVLVGVGSG